MKKLLVLAATSVAIAHAPAAGYPAELAFDKSGCRFALAIEDAIVMATPDPDYEYFTEKKAALNFKLFGLHAVGVGALWDLGGSALKKRVYLAEPLDAAQMAFNKSGYALNAANDFTLEVDNHFGQSFLRLREATKSGTKGNYPGAKSYVECEDA